MADLTYTNKATVRRAHALLASGVGMANKVTVLTSTHELAASASGTTVLLGRIPSNARIALQSVVYFDDLATSGSPTLDVGLAPVGSNVTADPDALNDGIDVATAASSARVVKDIANVGKRAWEFVSGQTTDPGGELDVYATVKDAATNAAGTVSCEILYSVD